MISKFIDLPDRDIRLIQGYFLAGWFPDLCVSAPYLWLVGPPGSAKTTLLRLLSALCRRSLLVGDIRPAALYQAVDSLDCTLLIDELESYGPEVMRLLRAGSTRGIPVVRNGRVFDPFAFKILTSRYLPNDPALVSRAIVVTMLPAGKELAPLTMDELRRITDKFQPPLLMYRFQHHAAVRSFLSAPFSTEVISPRYREFAGVLAAPLQEDSAAQAELIDILRAADTEMQVQRGLEPEWLGVETLLARCHESVSRMFAMTVGALACEVNDLLNSRGEDLQISARKLGEILRSLGIRSQRLGNLGRGWKFTQGFRRKIHEIAKKLGIDRAQIANLTPLENGYGGIPCDLCEEFGLTAGLKFVDSPGFRRSRRPSNRIPLFDRRDTEVEDKSED